MLKPMLSARLFICLVLLVTFIMPCCVSTKKSVYFTDISDTAKLREIIPAEFKEPVIQPDDILSITIQTIDPTNTAGVNQVSGAAASGSGQGSVGGQPTISGFLVDKNGIVSVPMLGNLKLAGLTTFQARELIQQKASTYFKEPTVQVRFANYKITVIGEVAKPATYTVPNEKVTILDALGMAGDLTIFGKRENILLVRDNNGKKELARLNLNSSDIFKSPYFYLRQNDVIYVEPGKGKIAANNAPKIQLIAIVASGLTVLLSLMRL